MAAFTTGSKYGFALVQEWNLQTKAKLRYKPNLYFFVSFSLLNKLVKIHPNPLWGKKVTHKNVFYKENACNVALKQYKIICCHYKSYETVTAVYTQPCNTIN